MQLDNENDLGELLDRDDCEATIERMGEIMGAVIDRFEDRTPELYEIARQGNVKTLRAAIKQAAHNLRQELADTLLSGIEEGKQP